MKSKFLICIVILLVAFSSYGQSKTSNPYEKSMPKYEGYSSTSSSIIDPDPSMPPPPPAPIPVDGGVGFLVAAGLGYGIRQMRKKNNPKN